MIRRLNPVSTMLWESQAAVHRVNPKRWRNNLIFSNDQQVIGRTVEQQTHGLDIFVLDGFRFVVDHFVEILIAHTQLLVEPVFRLTLFFQ